MRNSESGIREPLSFLVSRLSLLISLALCLSVPFLSCDRAPADQFVPRLNVHGLLHYDGSAGEQPLRVNVNRTYRISEPADSIFPGAEVRAYCSDTEQALDYRYRDTYETELDSGLVGPGATVRLSVAHPDFDTVWGSTIVPDTFSIIRPGPGETLTVRDSMAWSASGYSRGYYIAFSQIGSDTTVLEFLYPQSDSFPRDFRLFFLSRVPSGSYRLDIYALDRKYYNWLRRDLGGPGGFNDSDTFEVSGGVGVFGSGTSRAVELCLRCDSLPPPGPLALPPGAIAQPRRTGFRPAGFKQ